MYLKAASILQKLYTHGTVSMKQFRYAYQRDRRKHIEPCHTDLASGKIIRYILQQFQDMGLVRQDEFGERSLSAKGRSYMDGAAGKVLTLTTPTPHPENFIDLHRYQNNWLDHTWVWKIPATQPPQVSAAMSTLRDQEEVTDVQKNLQAMKLGGQDEEDGEEQLDMKSSCKRIAEQLVKTLYVKYPKGPKSNIEGWYDDSQIIKEISQELIKTLYDKYPEGPQQDPEGWNALVDKYKEAAARRIGT
jgi:hypothetical protein